MQNNYHAARALRIYISLILSKQALTKKGFDFCMYLFVYDLIINSAMNRLLSVFFYFYSTVLLRMTI